MARWKKILIAVLGVLCLAALLAATLLPLLIRDQAVKAIAAATGRNARIEKVTINPLTLTATVRGFALEEQGGGPFLSLERLTVSVSPASLYKRALVLSEVTVVAPRLRVVRAAADRFNFSDILERQPPKEEKPKAEGLFPFVLNRVTLTDGSLALEDRAAPGGRSHRIEKLAVELPWLSSLPADAERAVSPRLSLAFNGAPLALTGEVKPFRLDQPSTLHLTLQRLNLPELAVYVPQPPPVTLASAKLSLDLSLRFRKPAEGSPDVHLQGLTRLEDLALDLPNRTPLLKLPVLEVRAAALDPLQGRFALEAVALDGLELFVSRDRQGRWMYEPLLPAGPGKAPPAAAAAQVPPVRHAAAGGEAPVPAVGKPAAAPVQFSVASLKLREGRVHLRDEVPRGGFAAQVAGIALNVDNLTNRAGERGKYDLGLRLDGKTELASQGSFSLAEPAAQASLKLTGLPLQKGWPYLAAYLTAPVQGVLDLSGDVAYSAAAGVTAEKGRLALKDLAVRYGEGEGLTLASLAVEGAAFQQQANRLSVDRIRLAGGELSLSREADGRLSPLSLLASPQQGTAADPAPAAPVAAAGGAGGGKTPASPGTAAKPLAYQIKRFDLQRFGIAFTDKSRPAKPRFTLRDMTLLLADLGGPAPRPARLRFGATYGGTTPLLVAGRLTPAPFRYQGDLRIDRLPLRDFEAYYPETLNLKLLDGLLDVNLGLDVALKEGTPRGSFKGEVGIGAFHTVDTVEQEDLLKWQRLQLDKIDGDLEPLRLTVGEVSLNQPFARIIIREDGTLNLQDLVRKGDAGKGAAPAPDPAASEPSAAAGKSPATAAPAVSAEKPAPPLIRIGAVTLLDGTVSFTDKFLPNDFATTFYNLGGRISGLTSEPSFLADVDLRGNLESQSPLRITGKINPLREDLYVDVKLAFSDIELSPMSPYTETYLGYILKQGKLFLDLSYHIEDKKLVSENKIRVDQFTFGDEVQSDRATSLPVKLGLALLKDRNGEIHLDVPVTGRIDDPQFNIWRIVFQVIKNLLVKAVTAPFALLSSLFAGDGDLSVVAFAPGATALEPAEAKKLESLAKGLQDRPALKVSLTGYVDPEKDPEGYRRFLLERRLQREKLLALTRERKLPPGQGAETLTLTPAERATYLRALYARESFPKPRDAKGAEVKLSDEEMVKLILTHTKVERNELEDLAEARTESVKRYLVETAKLPAERIFQQKEDFMKAPAKGETPRSRVELNALAP